MKMPAQKQRASGTPEASGRRRSGRISSSGTKSKYFEADSDEESDPISSDHTKPSNGSGKKRGRPAKNAKLPVSSRGKRAKIESDHDDDDEDEYADENSEAELEEDDEEDEEDDENAPPRVTITPLVKLRETGGVPYEDDRLHKNTLLFLKDLKANNKRTWLKCECIHSRLALYTIPYTKLPTTDISS